MATFTIDLLSGKDYLFSGDFTGSGGTSGSYLEVSTYSGLPSAASQTGNIFVVRNGSGVYLINRKEAGLYYSNGVIWKRLGDIPSFFNANNFQIYDNNDNTKIVTFITSGISTNNNRKVTIQDSDGIIAYLDDLSSKLDTSVFNGYTATTGNSLEKIQLVSTGTTDVNTVSATSIDWAFAAYSASSFFWSGGSGVYILSSGEYELQYHATLSNDNSNQTHSIGGYLMLNGLTTIPISATATMIVGPSVSGELSLPTIYLNLNINDRLDLILFRIGNSGVVNLVENSVYIVINKIN